jgi:anti-anti-sigma factor
MALRLALNRETTRAGDGDAEPALRVDVVWEFDAVRVCPVGEIDVGTIEELRARMNEAMAATGRRVILDLRETTFLDSAMLHLVVEANTRASSDGTLFVIIRGPRPTRRTFDIAGLSERLPFVDVA